MRIGYPIILSLIVLSGISCSGGGDSKSAVRQFYSMDNVFIYIARQDNPRVMELAREFEKYSKHDVVETADHNVFHIIYANLRCTIRGMGGNGSTYVFRENNGRYDLVYHNCWDEMVNRIEIVENNGCIEMRTYAHIGLVEGPCEPIIYKWNGNEFVYLK